MEERDKYRKVVEALRKSEHGIRDRDLLKTRISGAIRTRVSRQEPAGSGSLLDQLFKWVEIPWMRWSVGSLATLLVAGFLVQQVGISQRMGRMEKQLIHIENGQLPVREGYPNPQQVLLRLYARSQTDSVTVSKADLEKLLLEYQQMKERSNPVEL